MPILTSEYLKDPTANTERIRTFFLNMEEKGLLNEIPTVLKKATLTPGEMTALKDSLNLPGFEQIRQQVNDFASEQGADAGIDAAKKFGAADGLTISPAFTAVAPDSIAKVIAEAGATPTTSPGRTA